MLNGDLDPKWTEVWAHINLGKIFDITDQRDRAVNEYRQAVRTKDNTQGAQEEAGKYINAKYQRPPSRQLTLEAIVSQIDAMLSRRAWWLVGLHRRIRGRMYDSTIGLRDLARPERLPATSRERIHPGSSGHLWSMKRA